MGDQQYDELYKVVLVGDPAVGKTNLLASFLALDEAKLGGSVDDHGVAKGFSSVRKPTIGVEFGTKIIQHPNGKRIKAQIWDTAGQERYRAITSSHYRRAAGALVVYDVTNKTTFDNARNHWLKELKASADPSSTLSACIILVGNKCDLETPQSAADANFVSTAAHTEAAAQLKLVDVRTSAKTALNVQRAFEELIISIYDEDKGKLQRMATIRTLSLDEPRQSMVEQRSKQCCNA